MVDKRTVKSYRRDVNPDKIYQHLGGVIKQRRKKLGLKQHDVAARLRISRGSLANIETGRQGVLVHQLYRFASVLGLQPSDFLLPVAQETSALEAEWTEAIPADLKPQQREQIARLLEGSPKAANSAKGGGSGKSAKK